MKIKLNLFDKHFLRKVKSFFYFKFLKSSLKIFIFLLFFCASAILFLFYFKRDFFENSYNQISEKFSEKLFLNFSEFKEVKITGNERVLNSEIIAIIHETYDSIPKNNYNFNFFTKKLILNLKNSFNWIDNIKIHRAIPDILNIDIEEYKPFAIWKKGEEIFVSNKDGHLIKVENLDDFSHLMILSGDNAYLYADSLFDIFITNPEISSNIFLANWVGNRRWNLKFDSGLIVKMPENNIIDAWKELIRIYNIPGSAIGLKVIDLRVTDKIYLEYEESLSKELKSL